MKITESRLRTIIRQELIKNRKLNEGLSDSLKSIYRKIFPEKETSTKSEKPKSEERKFQEFLDKKYELEMEKYGLERMVYINPFSKIAEPITSNIMRQYAMQVYLRDSLSRKQFLAQLPMDEFEPHQQEEILKALDLSDDYFRGRFIGYKYH